MSSPSGGKAHELPFAVPKDCRKSHLRVRVVDRTSSLKIPLVVMLRLVLQEIEKSHPRSYCRLRVLEAH
jgi:hypothetical protein